MRLMHDSKGCKSWTVTLVVPAALLLLIKFSLAGIKFGETVFASIDPVSFGTAFAAVIAPLVARDAWRFERAKNGSNPDQPPV